MDYDSDGTIWGDVTTATGAHDTQHGMLRAFRTKHGKFDKPTTTWYVPGLVGWSPRVGRVGSPRVGGVGSVGRPRASSPTRAHLTLHVVGLCAVCGVRVCCVLCDVRVCCVLCAVCVLCVCCVLRVCCAVCGVLADSYSCLMAWPTGSFFAIMPGPGAATTQPRWSLPRLRTGSRGSVRQL